MRWRSVCVLVAGVGFAPVAAVLGDELAPREPAVVASSEGPGSEPRQPQVAVDAQGRILVAFGVGDAIRCARSDDSGRTFTVAPVGSAGVLALGMRRGPRIVVAGDQVVVSAIAGREGKGRDGDLLAWRSADAGRTWDGPARVNMVEGSAREGLHGMASGPDGAVFCVWLDLRDRRTEVYGARSGNGGRTWDADRLVYRAPGGSICECCHPSVAYGPGGRLHVMWRNQVQGARDLYLASSTDGGATFGPAEKLGRGTWPLSACPMDGGSVAVGPEGQVETAWMRQGAIYAARPGEPERRLGLGVQAWTAVGAAGPVTVWLAARPGRLLAQVPNRPKPILLADEANDPVVAAPAAGQGPVIVVWEAKGSGSLHALAIESPSPAKSP